MLRVSEVVWEKKRNKERTVYIRKGCIKNRHISEKTTICSIIKLSRVLLCFLILWVFRSVMRSVYRPVPYHEKARTARLILVGCIVSEINNAIMSKQRHNERDGVSNHRLLDCLLNRLFRRRSKKTSKLRFTTLCEGNSPVAGAFPAQRPVMRKMFSFDEVNMIYGIGRQSLYVT